MRALTSSIPALLILSAGAAAQVVPYVGFDRVTSASTAAAANSLSAEAAWLNDAALLGPIHTVDFESMPPGVSGESHIIAPGVTMKVTHRFFYPDELIVESGASSYAPIVGFNTTAGGTNHMRFNMSGGSVHAPVIQLTFAQPICALSMFITGEGESRNFMFDFASTRLGVGPPSRVVNVGDVHHPYWPSVDQPNVRFAGLIEAGQSFTSAAINLRFRASDLDWRGGFSIDDIRWVEAPSPAPATLAVLSIPLAWSRRRAR